MQLFNQPPNQKIVLPASKPKLPRMWDLPHGLTPAQKRIYKILIMNPGSFIVPHKRKKRKPCFRLIDSNGNPMINLPCGIIRRMVKRYYLTKKEDRLLPVSNSTYIQLIKSLSNLNDLKPKPDYDTQQIQLSA